MQLSLEAEKIRDGLLQESFTIRRSLELSLVDDVELSTNRRRSQDWLNKIEKFHYSLEQLSDRLSPTHIEHSLPLAIQCVVEPWRTCNPMLKIEMELPAHWRHESFDCSIVVLRGLDELIRITSSEILKEISIRISLKTQKKLGELIVYISYPDVPTLISYSGSKELEYLSQTFRFLTSGRCFRQQKELTVAWHFLWGTQTEC